MKQYGKLVRDNIPDIIRANGEAPVVRILNDDEFWQAGIEKLGEETAELAEAKTRDNKMEELADLVTLVRALAERIGSLDELEQVVAAKDTKRGGFKKQIYLERTE